MRSLFAFLSVAFVAGSLSAEEPKPAQPKVKLVVLVVFDQLRADLIDKWQPHFGEDGFKRLQTQGAWFTECRYPFATTATGPGHASMLTGASPSRTGIVNNEWYDRKAGQEAYCAGTERYEIVPAPVADKVEPGADPKQPVKKRAKAVGTPERLLVPTLADEWKASAKPGKVFGLSLKDRSGILPSGRKPDGVYWFDGRFVTSTYYRDTPHKWADEFNKAQKADAWFGKDWAKFRPELDYEKLAGPDDAPGEGKLNGQGNVFPHPTDGGLKVVGKKYYEALVNSPFGNELLLEFAKTCIDSEKLGQGETADLLTLSFSSNDLVGHTFGPDSQEVLDTTLRSDAVLAALLKHLDAKVGKGNYAVILTADHGVCPLPDVAMKQGKDAGRVSSKDVVDACEKNLTEAFGKIESDGDKTATKYVEAFAPPYVYLNHHVLAAKKVTPLQAQNALSDSLCSVKGIEGIYSHEFLSRVKSSEKEHDEIEGRVVRSFHPDRSGDLYIVFKPYYLVGAVNEGTKLATGTNHGSTHDYDTHVPLLVYGPGVAGGKRNEAVTPLHAAAIGADFLGIAPPKTAEYGLPKTLAK